MKKIILLLLLLVILIPTTVNAQEGDEGYRVGEDGIAWERVEETWTFYRSDGTTYEETISIWREVGSTMMDVQHYNPNSGEIVCWDACWHEVAHKLDYEVMGDISSDPAFQEAIVDFLYREAISTSEPHPMTWRIILFPGFFNDMYIFPEDTGFWAGYVWGGYNELYADIFYWADGNFWAIPRNLREFYDMEAAQQIYDDVIAASDETIY